MKKTFGWFVSWRNDLRAPDSDLRTENSGFLCCALCKNPCDNYLLSIIEKLTYKRRRHKVLIKWENILEVYLTCGEEVTDKHIHSFLFIYRHTPIFYFGMVISWQKEIKNVIEIRHGEKDEQLERFSGECNSFKGALKWSFGSFFSFCSEIRRVITWNDLKKKQTDRKQKPSFLKCT